MIPLTSEQDKEQLRKHALELLKQDKFEGLVILVEVLKETDFELKDKNKALFWFSRRGNLEIVKCLVENGANVNAGDDYALYEAASCGHLEVVKYLVSKGSNIRSHRCQALKRAERNNHVEVVKYLEEVLRNDRLSRQARKETTAGTCS